MNPLRRFWKLHKVETHFFLKCIHFANQRMTLPSKIKDTEQFIFEKKDFHNPNFVLDTRNIPQQITNVYIRSKNVIHVSREIRLITIFQKLSLHWIVASFRFVKHPLLPHVSQLFLHFSIPSSFFLFFILLFVTRSYSSGSNI